VSDPVKITVFRWAGAWGPFKVNIPCGECSLTKDIIQDCIDTDLAGIEVELDLRDWLSEWWKPLPKGGWHAPIVLVNGKIISQGRALNRGVLTQTVIEAATADTPLLGNHVFGKSTCPHCVRAKGYLAQADVLPGGQLVAHEVLEDHPQLPAQRGDDLAESPVFHRFLLAVGRLWSGRRYAPLTSPPKEIISTNIPILEPLCTGFGISGHDNPL